MQTNPSETNVMRTVLGGSIANINGYDVEHNSQTKITATVTRLEVTSSWYRKFSRIAKNPSTLIHMMLRNEAPEKCIQQQQRQSK